MDDYRTLSLNPPSSIPWSEIVEFDRLDERRSCVDCLYANILGVSDGEVEWCPNDDPPTRDEKLAWLWFVRPDLAAEIQTDASAELRHLMESYQNNMMESWWKEITQ